MTGLPRDEIFTGSNCFALGVTGGVASGKSTLARLFESFGANRISADEIARDLLAPGSPTTHQVIDAFGLGIVQENRPDAIDRKALAKMIYADEAARRGLGEIMHPVIRERMRAQIEAFRNAGCELIVVEIPLLYENNLQGMVDGVLVAACSEAVQAQRLAERQPWLSAADTLRQVRSQLPIAQKTARADYVISTEASAIDIERSAAELFRQLRSTPARK